VILYFTRVIVVDPHAFRRLWPVLGVWLFFFLTAGDGVWLFKRQMMLQGGVKAYGIVTAKVREPVPMLRGTRNVVYFRFPGANGHLRTTKETVGSKWGEMYPGEETPVHVVQDSAVLDDDRGYTRLKVLVFGGIFAALWLWALGRYRFG